MNGSELRQEGDQGRRGPLTRLMAGTGDDGGVGLGESGRPCPRCDECGRVVRTRGVGAAGVICGECIGGLFRLLR